MTFEYVAAAYFVLIGVLAPVSGAPRRRWLRVSLTAFTAAASVAATARLLPFDARAWLAHASLAAGYWLPALLVTRSPGAFETWLRRVDKSVGAGFTRPAFAEVAYLCCYPLVPAAFITVYVNGSATDVDRFWTSVLGAGFLCYVSLPWLVSRPPRVLEDAIADLSPVRRLNLHVLDRLSHGWNTFPSGHVAVAIAAALTVLPVAPRAGIGFILVAAGIVIGAVTGRYHYTVDAAAGVLVGVTIPAMLARLMPLVALVFIGSVALHAQGSAGALAPSNVEGRGQQLFTQQCAACHGETLQGVVGPPLTGEAFAKAWSNEAELVDKIQKTMPQNDPGSLTRAQAADLAAFIVRAGASATAAAAPIAPVASHDTPTFPPSANLAQLMRGIFFPSSNIIFNVQGHDPGEKKTDKPYEPGANDNFSWAQWGAGIYSPWEIVDYAALSIADAAPLMLVPGRRCENGRPVPSDKDDWKKFTQQLIEVGKAAYKASQSRSQEAVSDVSNDLADACLQCHERYRDKPGGTVADPSNKAARCF